MEFGLKTYEILTRLRERYKAPEHAFFAEVANATGYGASRHADGLAMSLWPSRGLHLTGFEVKASRSDWIKELKNPKKADDIAKYCDYWYLVLGDPELIKKGELPVNWGLLLPTKKGLRVAKEAEKLNPIPMDRSFMASVMRSTCENSNIESQIRAAVARAGTVQYERGKLEAERKTELPYLRNELAKQNTLIDQFRDSSGIDLRSGTWRTDYPKMMGEAVKFIMDGGMKGEIGKITWLKNTIKGISEHIETFEKFIEANDV